MEEIREELPEGRRELPNSPEAERAVIASMLMDSQAIVDAMEILSGDEFYNSAYALMFQCIVEIYNESAGEKDHEIDAIILTERMKRKGAPPEVASVSFIMEVMNSVSVSTRASKYANEIREKAKLRKIIALNRQMEEEALKGQLTSAQVIGEMEDGTMKLAGDTNDNDITPIDEIVMNTIEKINEAYKNKGGGVTGVSTGFIDLDEKLAGLQPADMILVAARPSMGKTALALNIAADVAFHQKKPVAIFSLEMPKESLVNRMLSMESHIEADKIRRGNLKDSEWNELIAMSSVIADSNLLIDDHTGITLSYFASRCRKMKQQHPDLALVMIDYLQLMQGSGNANISRQQEVSDISRGIKQVAREINAPIIALSQLSRAPEQRPDHRPMLSDLRESGAIEQDADVAMFIYRDDYYHPDTEKKNISEIIIAKQRNGAVGTVELAWLPEYTKFGNLEQHRS